MLESNQIWSKSPIHQNFELNEHGLYFKCFIIHVASEREYELCVPCCDKENFNFIFETPNGDLGYFTTQEVKKLETIVRKYAKEKE